MSDFFNPETTLISDTECYPNFWSIIFRRVSDKKEVIMEHSARRPIDRRRLHNILSKNLIIGYNWQGYDQFMVTKATEEGVTNAQLKRLNDNIIVGTEMQFNGEIVRKKLKWWEIEDALGIRVPREYKFIDLMEPQPNARANLKQLMARMHAPWLQDLPYDPDTELTEEQMDFVLSYMGNDALGTHMLFDHLREPLALRAAFGKKYGIDLMSKSDSQCGEAIFKKRVQDKTGNKVKKIDTPPGSIFRFTPPSYIQFEPGGELDQVFKRVCASEFILGPDRKVKQPEWLEKYILKFGGSEYSIGIGGLHSTEANRALWADDDYVLVDFDVGSYYPRTILGSGLYPKAIGPEFLPIYGELTDDRMTSKRIAADETAAPAIRYTAKITADGVKIFVNGGGFGKLGSAFSPLFAPHLMIATTLTGQWAILMFNEWAEKLGVSVVSANTDGVVLRIPRSMMGPIVKDRVTCGALSELVAKWEATTGFALEATEYSALLNASVNEYIAIKPNGKCKRKGKLSNPYKEDVRTMLTKNPNGGVCSDAVVALLTEGTPIEETIYNCTDVRDFVSAVQVDGGAYWTGDGSYLGKVVRYIWCRKGGAEIVRKRGHHKTGTQGKVPKTDGCRPLMTLPDELPDDIDYARYIEEAKQILIDIGYAKAPPKIIRFTKKNTAQILQLWAIAA